MQPIEDYLDVICAHIRNRDLHTEIRAELRAHLEEIVAELSDEGATMEDAIATALERVGDPVVIGKRMNRVYKPRLDFRLLGLSGLAVALGLFSLALVPGSPGQNSYLFMQVLWVGLGFLGLMGAYHIHYRHLARLELPLYLITLGAVLINFHTPGTRFFWLEGAKITFILSLAGHLAKNKEELKWRSLLAYGVIPCLCVLIPSSSAALLFVFLLIGMVWRAGVPKKQLYGVVGGFFTLGLLYLLNAPDYQLQRIAVFFNPGQDPLGAGYSVIQAKNAISAAGLWGQGLFKGNHLLPEPHTDFIFASLVHQAGWVVGLAVLVVFAFLLMRVFWVISRARGLFPTLVAFGIGTMLLFNIAWNLGMQVGLLPTAGINLPFFSYGGSAMLMNFIAMGLLLNIAKEIQPVLYLDLAGNDS
jgi:rod shape determining protein RodA